jgi:hypothetical protein
MMKQVMILVIYSEQIMIIISPHAHPTQTSSTLLIHPQVQASTLTILQKERIAQRILLTLPITTLLQQE